MTDAIAHKLRIKYGLTRDPSDVEITKWRRRVEEAIANGDEPEQTGRAAALEAFGELDAILLFSEADTIKALLRRLAASERPPKKAVQTDFLNRKV